MRIVKYPHPTLLHRSRELKLVDRELRKAIAEMFELMYEHQGIGLAANQVDLPYRVFILNVTGDPAVKDEEHVLINPTILKRSGNMVEADEGCLSFPGIYAPVRRADHIVAVAYNLAGEEVQYAVDGLFARAFQHEHDHLDGKLFIERLTPSHLLNIKDDLLALEAEFSGDRRRGVMPDERQIVARLTELERLRT